MGFHSISTCDVTFQTFIFTNATKMQRCGGQCQGAPKRCRLGRGCAVDWFLWLRDLRIGLVVDVFSWQPSHFISFHLISSHFISFHLIDMPMSAMSLNLCQKQTKLRKSITLTSQISLVILRLLHVLLPQMHQLAPTQQAAMLGFEFVFKPFQGYIELGLIWKKLLPPIQISQYWKKNPSKLQWSNQFTGKTVFCLASNSSGVYQNQTTFRMFLAHF